MTRRWQRGLAAGTLAVALFTGCSAGRIVSQDQERGFLLTLSAPRQVWSTGQAIEVSATLSYLGPGAIQVWGPGPGDHIGFGLVELTGHRKLEPSFHQACRSWWMTHAVPIKVPYRKAGGFTAEDPNAAWYERFFADPVFRLPAGRWQVTAHAPLSLGNPESCGGESVDLLASLTLIVR